jgi:hypothetical protein
MGTGGGTVEQVELQTNGKEMIKDCSAYDKFTDCRYIVCDIMIIYYFYYICATDCELLLEHSFASTQDNE